MLTLVASSEGRGMGRHEIASYGCLGRRPPGPALAWLFAKAAGLTPRLFTGPGGPAHVDVGGGFGGKRYGAA